VTASVLACPSCGCDVVAGVAVDGWLSMRETAALLGVSLRTMEAWRRTWLPGAPTALRRGPEPVQDGDNGRIWYREGDVLAILAARGQR
jgi:hypothetical protein